MHSSAVPGGRTVHTPDGRGFIRDWLVSPAWSSPCDDLAEVLAATGSPWGSDGRWVLTNGPDVAPLKARLYARHQLLTDQPLPEVVDGGPISWRRCAGDPPSTGAWQRYRAGIDGLVDWSRFCYTPEYRHALAAAVIEVDQPEYRELEVGCTGPVAVFVDGRLVLHATEFGYMEPVRHRVRVRFRSGVTPVHVATWQVAFREVRQVLSVRVVGPTVRVVIPSPGADEFASADAERLLDSISVGPWASRDGTVRLAGPEQARLRVSIAGASDRDVVLSGGTAVVDLTDQNSDDEQAEGAASMLSTGEIELTLRVDDPTVPVLRTARVAILPKRQRDRPSDDDATTWRRELLLHVAEAEPSVGRALARHALRQHDPLQSADLQTARRMLTDRYDCADFEAVGLVHLWHRIPESLWSPTDRERVRRTLTGFKYWIDQPGLDAMCYFTENHQFVWHTAELLTGELFSDATFGNSGWTGRQHAEHAAPLAEEWIRRKLTGGFSEFDSNAYLAIDAFALVSVVEFAESVALRQLAEALLDKLLLSLASNSWFGAHGSAHGRTYTHTLRSARFEETAPIMWLLWGMGALNTAVLPASALATAEHYQVPAVIAAIARNPPPEWDGRQVYRGDYRLHHDLLERPYRSDLRVFRTPDAMLSSVQDYRAGLPGLQEHVWGATLASEIQVFATHPAAASISPSARPNSWAGQRILPRAHQDRDTVLVVHRIPDDDWIGTTHLWFPADQFDEWQQAGSWIAGRHGDGYVAVSTAGGVRAQTSGDEAGQCWWPVDGGRSYVATIGRRAVDGSFAEFVASLAEPQFGGAPTEPSVRWLARDGRVLQLTWSEPFTVDGAIPNRQAGDSTPHPVHLDSPACRQSFGADRLLAEWAGERLIIDYSTGRRLEPPSGVRASATDREGV